MWLDPDRLHHELLAATGTVAEILADGDPTRTVPTCPEWTLHDLAGHIGRGHRWAAAMIEARVTAPDAAPAAFVPLPDRVDAEWLVAGARLLGDTVLAAGPDAAVWSWTADRTAGFWLRRMTHDALVHRVDAELTDGRTPVVAPDLAADNVSDLLVTIATLSASDWDPRFAAIRGDGQTVHLHATDDPALGEAGEWFAHRAPAGVRWEHGHRKGDVAVRGRAADLMLVLNRRAAPDRVEVLGDRALFEHWLAHTAF